MTSVPTVCVNWRNLWYTDIIEIGYVFVLMVFRLPEILSESEKMNRNLWQSLIYVAALLMLIFQIGNLFGQWREKRQVPQETLAPAKQYKKVVMDWHTVATESNVWKISKAGQPDSYLLGTKHFGKKGAAMNPALAELVAKNQKIMTEVKENPSQQEIEKLGSVMVSKTPLAEKMGQQPFERLTQQMRRYANGEQAIQNINQVKPWTALMLVMGLSEADEDRATGVESFIHREAKRLKKEQSALETHAEVVMYFALLSDDLSVAALNDWAVYPDDSQHEKGMTLAYQQGEFHTFPTLFEKDLAPDADNQDTLLTLNQQQALNDWLVQDLLIARNKNWLPIMKREMGKQPTLFAVGFGHLMGSHGLIEMLRQEGYSVTPEPKLLVWQ